MIVYVELVLFDNFCLDALIGSITLRCLKEHNTFYRVVLSALVGCLFALISPLINSYIILFKVAVLFANSAVLYLKKALRGYFITTLVYAAVSFTLSGIMTFLLDGKLSYTFIGIEHGGIVGITSISICLMMYIARQIKGIVQEKRRSDKYAVAEFFSGEMSVRLNALFDTGNLLTDRNGNGIVVIDEKSIRTLGDLQAYGEMNVKTAGGNKMLKLVKIPCIKIYSGGSENTLNNVTVALSDLPKEYAAILPA